MCKHINSSFLVLVQRFFPLYDNSISYQVLQKFYTFFINLIFFLLTFYIWLKALGSISIRYVYLNSFFTQSTIALNIESNISISPFFRISDITVFLTHDSVMQTIAKPVPQPATVVRISVVTRAVKPNILIPPFLIFVQRFFPLYDNSISYQVLQKFYIFLINPIFFY